MSEDFLGIDIKIDPDTQDMVLDAVGEPLLVKCRDCLSQDLRHALLMSGEVAGFIHRDVLPGDARELENKAVAVVEQDPRVVPNSAEATVTKADAEGLEIEVEYLPVGQDNKDNLVVRLGGFGG